MLTIVPSPISAQILLKTYCRGCELHVTVITVELPFLCLWFVIWGLIVNVVGMADVLLQYREKH